MFKITVDTVPLQRAMLELSRETRKDMHFIVRQQAGIMVGQLIAITPPGDLREAWASDAGGISLTAKKRGEARIAEEINAIFPTSRLRDERVQAMINRGYWWGVKGGRRQVTNFAPTLADLQKFHRAARSPATGRLRKLNGAFMAVTRTSARKALIRQQQAKVGALNAGWLSSARQLKTAKRNTPSWITRHGANSGDVREFMTVGGIVVTLINRMPHFPNDMDRRLAAVVSRRTYGITKALENMVRKRAEKATRQMQ